MSDSTGANGDSKNVSSSNIDNRLDESAGASESASLKSISSQLENEKTPGQRKQRRAPSKVISYRLGHSSVATTDEITDI